MPMLMVMLMVMRMVMLSGGGMRAGCEMPTCA